MLDLKNEFIFAPVKTGLSDGTGKITEKHINFYKRRSNNIGAIILEPLYMDKGLREIPTQIGIDDEDKEEGLKYLIDELHKKNTKVIAHLNHPGRQANPNIPGNYFLSSTDKPCLNGGATPKRMTEEDIKNTINLFVNAAKRAEKVGFDMIEIQAGHGYLLAQFLSPAVNDRTDEYGGSFENRIKFPLKVINSVIENVNIPVIVRISGEEIVENGIKVEENIKFVSKLENISAVHVVVGNVCFTPPWFFQHMFVKKGKTWEIAKIINEKTKKDVIYVGRINSIDDIKFLKNNFNAKYIALGRALIADPDFLDKYYGKNSKTVRPCLACSEGCLGGIKSGKGIQCVVNPFVGREEEEKIEPAKIKKRVAIIGGGAAGATSAIILKERGHDVTLFEKEKIGGQVNLAYLPPNKDTLKDLIKYFEEEIKRLNIKVVKKEFSPEDFSKEKNNFDIFIIATGSKPNIPPIKGLKEYFWAEILEDENMVENKKVVIIGGGLIGVETAAKLASKNNEVIIIEMLSEIGRGMEMIEKNMTMKLIKNKNVKIYTDAKVLEVDGKKVIFEKDGNKKIIENVDHIIISTGMKSYNPFDNLIRDAEYYVIGDAKKVGKIMDAIKDAYDIGLKI